MSKRSWLLPGLVLLWTAIHGWLLFQSGQWNPPGAPWWALGSPGIDRLLTWGALVPARVHLGEWPRLLLHAFLHTSLLGLALDIWIALWAGRTFTALQGAARAWTVFLVASAAGAGAETLLARGASTATLHVGAWFGILGWVGGLGVWAFAHTDPVARRLRRTTLVFLVIVGGLSWWLGGSWWGMLFGFAGGILAALLLGFRGGSSDSRVRVGAATLLVSGALATAIAVQAAAPDRFANPALGAFLEEVAATESLADRLYERPDRTRPEERSDLGQRLDRLAASRMLEGFPGQPELRAYLEALRPVATGDIPDPFAFEHRRDVARRAWRAAERRIRAASGVPRTFGGSTPHPAGCR